MPVAKVIELVGSSPRSFDDALSQAVKRASKTIKGVRGADVLGHKVILKNGKIAEYRVHLKLAFEVQEVHG